MSGAHRKKKTKGSKHPSKKKQGLEEPLNVGVGVLKRRHGSRDNCDPSRYLIIWLGNIAVRGKEKFPGRDDDEAIKRNSLG